jgi:hypothetical protein
LKIMLARIANEIFGDTPGGCGITLSITDITIKVMAKSKALLEIFINEILFFIGC